MAFDLYAGITSKSHSDHFRKTQVEFRAIMERAEKEGSFWDSVNVLLLFNKVVTKVFRSTMSS